MAKPKTKQQGFVALIALLIVATVGLTVGIALSLRGIEEVQLSYGIGKSAVARQAAMACAEEGLERLRQTWSSVTLSLQGDENSCILQVEVIGGTATVSATGEASGYQHQITVMVDTDRAVQFWQES